MDVNGMEAGIRQDLGLPPLQGGQQQQQQHQPVSKLGQGEGILGIGVARVRMHSGLCVLSVLRVLCVHQLCLPGACYCSPQRCLAQDTVAGLSSKACPISLAQQQLHTTDLRKPHRTCCLAQICRFHAQVCRIGQNHVQTGNLQECLQACVHKH